VDLHGDLEKTWNNHPLHRLYLDEAASTAISNTTWEVTMKRTLILGIVLAAAAGPVFADCGSSHAAVTASNNIVETAVSAGTFNTLVAAVQAADLAAVLSGDGPYTVFAPTDEAFAKLPAGTIEALLADPAKLREILLYHVVPGRVTAAQVVNLHSATTAQGSDIAILVADGSVMVNDSTVIATDIESSNGVIHVIDTVMIPTT
jgi:uncharacterized surface protein with fasciclin (FAS1) repeats